MVFKSHIENSLASLREATLVATKQSIVNSGEFGSRNDGATPITR
ncbi:MAG: hypothetical protein QMO91_01580 [Candidatus Tisiphia sp.]|nr:hypothetical protein [Candidatus Tisiphia sp.]